MTTGVGVGVGLGVRVGVGASRGRRQRPISVIKYGLNIVAGRPGLRPIELELMGIWIEHGDNMV